VYAVSMNVSLSITGLLLVAPGMAAFRRGRSGCSSLGDGSGRCSHGSRCSRGCGSGSGGRYAACAAASAAAWARVASAAGAQSHDEVAGVWADHGTNIVRVVVSRSAGRLSSWAVNGNTSWEVGAGGSRWHKAHAACREGVAVDVGDVVVDVAGVPCELELRHISAALGRGELD